MNIQQHGARGIRDIGHMQFAFAELPRQPGIYGAECQFTACRPLACAGNMIEQPFEFACRKIRIEYQPGFCLNFSA
jgi:hypothetical protein